MTSVEHVRVPNATKPPAISEEFNPLANSTNSLADVLIIDDDERLSEVLQALLESDGLQVSLASNGAEGLLANEKLRPKTILLDLQMPVLDGLEFLKHLRKRDPFQNIPVILISSDRNVAHFARMFPNTVGLRKPFDLLQLLRMVQQRLPQCAAPEASL